MAGSEKGTSAGDQPKPAKPLAAPKPAPLTQQLWVWFKALQLVMKYSSRTGKTRQQLAILVGSTGLKAWFLMIKVKLNEQNVYYQNTGQVRPWRRSIAQGIAAAFVLACFRCVTDYVHQSLALIWRRDLTMKLHEKYFASSRYYKIAQGGAKAGAIVDADVRITEDVSALSTSVAGLLASAVSGITDVALFGWLLCRHLRRKAGILTMMSTLGYSIGIYIVSNYIIVVDWARLLGAGGATQSALKQALMRAETHSTTICALQGGAMELGNLTTKLRAALAAKMQSFWGQERLNTVLYTTFTGMLDNSPTLWLTFTWGIASVLAMSGDLSGGRALPRIPMSLQTPRIAQAYADALKLFWEINYCLSGSIMVLVALHSVLQSFAAIMRIQVLDMKLSIAVQPMDSIAVAQENDCLEFKDVSIHTPSGALLVDSLSFTVKWGEALLLTGHNGAGKSSIFRCLGGLWPVRKGSITRPILGDSEDSAGLAGVAYYLPQRPYNALGTLMEQFFYPDMAPSGFTEGELSVWLDFADLGHLANMPGAFTEERDWEQVLSRGEQQRLGILRVFYRRPRFAVLDECTSAVSGEIEKRLFELCPKLGISCVTIAHRPALLQYHQRQLNLTGKPTEHNGGYELAEIPEGAKPFNPEEVLVNDPKLVILDYLGKRGIQLAGTQRESVTTKDLVAERKKVLGNAQVDLREDTPGSSRSKLHPALVVGLRQPGAMWRIVAVVVGLLLRTHLVLEGWKSIAGIFGACFTWNFELVWRAFAVNLSLVSGLVVVDRGIKRLSNTLQLWMYHGTASRIHELLFQGGAIHYGAALGLPITPPAARAGEAGAFATTLNEFIDSSLKPCLTAFYGAFQSVRLQGWPPLFVFLGHLPIHLLCALFWMPDHRTHIGELAHLEANFKTVHGRFRQNLEPIAFSGGGKAEQRLIERRFSSLVDYKAMVNRDGLFYNTVESFLTHGDMLPLMAMRVLSFYWTYTNTAAVQQGGISANELVRMWRFDRSTTLVVNNMAALAKLPASLIGLNAVADRMTEFLYGLETASAQAPTVGKACKPDEDRYVYADCIDIITPGLEGNPLALGVGFKVARGEALIITGPNASGKSLLGGLLAGLRPLHGKCASVSVSGLVLNGQLRPCISELMLLPQRPYLAPGGLGDQVAYPFEGSTQDPAELQRCLDVVGIGYLVERHGGLDKDPELPWDEILSGGEQQRIGVSRCLFQRPTFAVLDDCTSMVSQEAEFALYKSIVDCGTIPITISQRLSLPEMHSQELKLGIDTLEGWSLTRLTHWRVEHVDGRF